MHIRVSFVAKFAAVCLSILVVTTVLLGTIFIVNLRSITQREAEASIGESMLRLKTEVFARLNGYAGLLKNTSAAVVSLLDISDAFPQTKMEDFLIQTMKNQPDVSYLYYASNIKWNLPGSCFVINDRWIPGDDYDQTKRSWFVNAKKAGGEVAYTDPYIEASTGRLTIALSMTVFDYSENDIGVATAEIPVDSFAAILNTERGMSQQVYLLDQNGSFIIHPDKDAVMKKNFFTEYHLESIKSRVLSEPSVSLMEGGMYLYSAAIPGSGWRVVSLVPTKVIFAEVNRLLINIILVSAALLIIAGACAVLFTRQMLISPIKEINQTASSIADMDFTVDIPHFRNDEIGTIERALINIRDSLHKAMDDLNAHVSTVTANSSRLKTAIVESSDALGTITDNMDVMQGETDTQMQSVDHTSQSISEIVKSIESLDQAIHTQAAHITESSAAIEEMVANIDAIRSVVAKVTKTTDTLSESSAAGHSMLVKLTEAINRINEQSAALQNANKTIADMTGQTNILAMNAAIEAAHAGEAGRGFAVVAGEIRKLAELSGKESNAISEEIKKIERGMEQITGISHETVQSMDRIFKEIKAIDASFTQVNHAVEEQAAGGSQILIALKTILDMTGQVRDGAKTIRCQSDSIHEEMSTLRRISQDVTSRAHEVKLASGSIASFLENTKALAG